MRSSFGGGTTRTFGVFNLAPPPGAPSELGINPFGAPIVFVPSIRQADGEYGTTLKATNVPQLVGLTGLTLTIWGTPWSILHNGQRGNCLNEVEPSFGWAKCSVGRPAKAESAPHAYLTLPTSCEEPIAFTARAGSWQRARRGRAAKRRRAAERMPIACLRTRRRRTARQPTRLLAFGLCVRHRGRHAWGDRTGEARPLAGAQRPWSPCPKA